MKNKICVNSKKKTKINSGFCQIVKNEIKQFCLNTALHGYKYIVQKNTSIFARIFWLLVICTSFIISIFLLWSSWQYNLQNSILTAADTVYNPIWNYIFPAVTICNVNKVSLKKLNYFVRTINDPLNFDEQYIKTLITFLVKILHFEYNSTYNKYYNDLQTLIDTNNLTVQNVMMSIRPDCNDLLRSCVLKGRIWRCDSLFEETTSIEGLCCSSNYYALQDRMFSGYLHERYKTKPRRMSACGSESGYKILINNQPEDYFLADLSGYGTKILIHDAYNYPSLRANREILGMSEIGFLKIMPSLTYGTRELKSLKISDRYCLFPSENSLKYFRNYSHINCLIECRVNLIKNKCGCIPLFFWNMKSIEFNQSKEYACNIKSAPCVASLKDTLQSFFPGFKYNGTEEFNYAVAEKQSLCKCIPNCENRLYSMETSKTIFSGKQPVNNFRFFDGFNTENYSTVTIYFKDLIATRYRKDINISWYSELAWLGGLLGLCTGFSFTSGFEMLYYFSIRFIIDYFYNKNKTKQLMNKKPKRKVVKVTPAHKNANSFSNHTVPPLHELYQLKNTNNPWYID